MGSVSLTAQKPVADMTETQGEQNDKATEGQFVVRWGVPPIGCRERVTDGELRFFLFGGALVPLSSGWNAWLAL
jgi:hypothetical protein